MPKVVQSLVLEVMLREVLALGPMPKVVQSLVLEVMLREV